MWEKKTTKQLTDAERGYGPAHKKLRQQWENRFARGEDHACARCGQLVNPYEPWDLGHTDDRTGWTGPEHTACNRGAGARNATKAREKNKRTIWRDW